MLLFHTKEQIKINKMIFKYLLIYYPSKTNKNLKNFINTSKLQKGIKQ